MRNYIIVLTSITYIHKIKELLSRSNIKSHIVKLQATYERRGCGYGLEINEHYIPQAVSLIENSRVRIVEIIQDNGY